MRRMKSAVIALALASAGVAIPVQVTYAANESPTGCVNESWKEASRLGVPSYTSWGSAVGTWNDSTLTKTLSYTLSVGATVSSSMQAGASVSVGVAIATVEASTSYSVESSVTGSRSVSDTLSVPGKRYGYDQPKVERTTFEIRQYTIGSNCAQTSRVLGYLNGITSAPFFSSCVSTSACTPKP